MVFGEKYPYDPPQIFYIGEKIEHPNINNDVVIMEILDPVNWNATFDINYILWALELRMIEPNPKA